MEFSCLSKGVNSIKDSYSLYDLIEDAMQYTIGSNFENPDLTLHCTIQVNLPTYADFFARR